MCITVTKQCDGDPNCKEVFGQEWGLGITRYTAELTTLSLNRRTTYFEIEFLDNETSNEPFRIFLACAPGMKSAGLNVLYGFASKKPAKRQKIFQVETSTISS
jgi:hypothetical protein